MTRLAAILLLSACTAQADEPTLKLSERHRIEAFAEECLIKFGSDKCLEACRAAFPDDGSDGNQERWLVCSVLVAKGKGG